MEIAFSGTQAGMAEAQAAKVSSLLLDLRPDVVHHGDCIGADAQCHGLCAELGIPLIIHPPTNVRKQAKCSTGIILAVRDAKDYLERDREMVDEPPVKALIAAPKGYTEHARSGTWYTVRYAKKQGKRVFLVFPDGSVEVE